ncbi:cytochrome P450 [Kribbella sp. NPDC050820]|uniref:cytochrome P450 n=1 Tax=Kribbella sp. NPDC050820 TaxID=3155408 RepID=UPI0034092DA8
MTLLRMTTPDGREAWQARSYRQVSDLMADQRLSLALPSQDTGAWANDSPMHRVYIRLARRPVDDGDANELERTRRRAVVSKLFKPTAVETTARAMSECADRLADELASRQGPVDIVESFAMPLALHGVCSLLAIPVEDGELFTKWAKAQESRVYPQAAIAMRHLNLYVNTLIESRRDQDADDVLTRLMRSMPMDDLHLGRAATLVTWMLGLGWQLSGHAISYGLYLFLQNPDQRELLLADPDLTGSAVEEVLRFFNPTPVRDIGGTDRFALEAFEYDGTTIDKGDMVVLDVGAANRDPQVFQRPGEFHIRRDPNPHLTFGHGLYYCNFNQVARTELAVGLDTLLRLPGLKLAVPDAELKMLHFPATGFRALPVRL